MSAGEVGVPERALYGPQTQRAVESFRGIHRPMPVMFPHCLATVEAACARANAGCKVLAVNLEATDIPEDELRELLAPARLTGAS